MAEITIHKVGKRARVRFPHALQKEFKEAFPSATHDQNQMGWEVGPRTVKRAEDWALGHHHDLLADVRIIEETGDTTFYDVVALLRESSRNP